MAFLIAAEIMSDVDSWLVYYLNKERTGWTHSVDEAFQASIWQQVEPVYKDLCKKSVDHDLTSRPMDPLLKEVFEKAFNRRGKLKIFEWVPRTIVQCAVNLK